MAVKKLKPTPGATYAEKHCLRVLGLFKQTIKQNKEL